MTPDDHVTYSAAPVRSPADIIKAIVNNLAMAADASFRQFEKAPLQSVERAMHRASFTAYIDCVTLVNTEAASLLTVTP